ncbi:hypothetical protein C7441_11072 [Pseudaminobacter salicylatoxidans]|uniref:Uncharacterized protein n=1 Tax=Pseudaminobacter salicylatoxidans TaxID=93369 RepID=A0A316C0L2_PSESE|nr:hypothetical protein [Pseudaminobacter salicylatoxidans]PWJ81540.1 hypothetical protein C7441_11072 [Pseudaminobacter salicylatoxidans]
MNGYEARGVWTGLYWRGEFRCADQGDFRVVQINGKEGRFESRETAELAAHKALAGYMNGNLVRFGGSVSFKEAAKNAADQIFRKGGKVIPVERRS